MPTFDYRCNNCDITKEVMVKKYDDTVECDKCEFPMKKGVSAPAVLGMDSHGRSGNNEVPFNDFDIDSVV
jgi:putative FmdB family regulatory protein